MGIWEPIADRDVELIRIAMPLQSASFRLACFPHEPDSSEMLWHLARQLLPSVEVLAVQYPHGDARNPGGRTGDLDELVGDSALLLSGWSDLPLALFGHHSGGEVALRVADRLERELGVDPLCTFVADRGAWGVFPAFETARLRSPVIAFAGAHDAPRCAETVNLIHDGLLAAQID
ncbi:thioesterase domain-containing protein [Streptomyces sp. NPDC007100]|uniref:thioesterase domain-containing protein n=1 Tax=Streptomyces sp. NPDC007100 TaxID=3155602 RepID=UPI0033F45EB1